MNHQKIHDDIILNAKLQNRIKHKGVYYEDHHIVPRCLGGGDEKENLVLLTAREHFIVHKLLTYIYKGHRGIACAFHLMIIMKDKKKYGITSRDYAYAKEIISSIPVTNETKQKLKNLYQGKTLEDLYGDKKAKDIKKKHKKRTGNKNPFFSKSHSIKTRNILSENHRKVIIDTITMDSIKNLKRTHSYTFIKSKYPEYSETTLGRIVMGIYDKGYYEI